MRRRSGFGYGGKLGLSHVALVVVVGTAVMALIDRQLGADLLSDLDTRLEAQAKGAAAWASEGRHPDRLAARLGGIVGAHVTIFDASGHVIGDSATEASLGADESRAPEVAAALSGRAGRASRPSPSGVETRFVTVPASEGMVLRLGTPVETIRVTLHRVRARLAVASGLGVIAAILLSSLVSRLASRPLRAMRDAARRIADGDYSVALAAPSPDEFGELSRSLSTWMEPPMDSVRCFTMDRPRPVPPSTRLLAGVAR